MLSTAMVVDGDGASAARRRRERHLRSWWRHEQQSVAMALSAAAHHSFDKVAAEAKYAGLRAQTTDRAEAAHQATREKTLLGMSRRALLASSAVNLAL